MNAPEYICRSCKRVVDPDLEPSPDEARLCPDCAMDLRRETIA